MPRYKPYDYNQLMMIPVSLEEQLVPGTLEYAIHHLIEERIEKFLSESERKKGASGKEIQSTVTDNESAKMVSSHGVIQGYNGNALVDEKHQVVVHA